MSEQTYYRLHWGDCPEFGAANAWSALWGAVRSEDGSRTECRACDGEGCEDCDGEGWQDACEGYSCCGSAEELIEYMALHGPGGEGTVIVFTGRRVGNGFDGEPLVVPAEVVETMTWAQLVAGVAA